MDKTADIDEKIDEEIDKAVDEIAGSDFEPVSFVSAQNTNIDLVQFAMQTPAITIPEEEEPETEAQTESFWEKVEDLFEK